MDENKEAIGNEKPSESPDRDSRAKENHFGAGEHGVDLGYDNVGEQFNETLQNENVKTVDYENELKTNYNNGYNDRYDNAYINSRNNNTFNTQIENYDEKYEHKVANDYGEYIGNYGEGYKNMFDGNNMNEDGYEEVDQRDKQRVAKEQKLFGEDFGLDRESSHNSHFPYFSAQQEVPYLSEFPWLSFNSQQRFQNDYPYNYLDHDPSFPPSYTHIPVERPSNPRPEDVGPDRVPNNSDQDFDINSVVNLTKNIEREFGDENNYVNNFSNRNKTEVVEMKDDIGGDENKDLGKNQDHQEVVPFDGHIWDEVLSSNQVDIGFHDLQNLQVEEPQENQSEDFPLPIYQKPFDFRHPESQSNILHFKQEANNNVYDEGNVEDIDQKACTCRKIKCLKLYCECFANKRKCTSLCKCINCKNNDAYEVERSATVDSIEIRNKEAFTKNPRKSCNCRKSHCLKRYCECFQAGHACSVYCKCVNCDNKGPSFLHRF